MDLRHRGSVNGELLPYRDPVLILRTGPLLLNVAVALTVSVFLALASERFVFRRLRPASEAPKAG